MSPSSTAIWSGPSTSSGPVRKAIILHFTDAGFAAAPWPRLLQARLYGTASNSGPAKNRTAIRCGGAHSPAVCAASRRTMARLTGHRVFVVERDGAGQHVARLVCLLNASRCIGDCALLDGP